MHRRRQPTVFRLVVLIALAAVVTAGLAAPAVALPTAGGGAGDAGAVGAATSGGQSCAYPYTATDATGTAVTVESDPERIVALQPSAAQTMWEIGARDEVVGMPVSEYTSDLDGYREPTNVVAADGFTVNVEAVVNLTPDLVLAPNVTSPNTVAQLRRAGLIVYHFGAAESIEDVYGKTLLTGQLTGNCDGAAERTAEMRVRIDRIREAVAEAPTPSVLYPLGGGVVAGSDTFLDEIIETAGGSNLAAAEGISGYGQISAEVIVARDPQWLILNENLPRSAIQMDAYNETTAVREGHVVRINPNYANQPAPRVALVVEQIARALHPEAMAEANATASPTGDGGTRTSSAGTMPETSGPGQPGFGLVAGIVGIAVALLAATRRSRRP